MRFSRLLLATPLLVLLNAAARGDDTEEFLKPDNWHGRADLFKLDSKARTIVGETMEDPKYNTFLCTKKKYGDFELSFKVQLRDGVGNSGVQIRSTLRDETKFVVAGPQVDVGKGYWGSLYGEGVGGMMKASDPAKIKTAVKESEFNEYKIVARGTHITVTINGETMVDQDFPTLPGKDKRTAPTEGIIAIQVHAGYPKMRVEYTDIKFTDLSKK
jgi:Domain of Unknown Function (DUF1080)